MPDEPYLKCELRRHPDAKASVAWIPQSFAKKGKVLAIKENGQWIDGWIVCEVGITHRELEYLLKQEK